MKSLAMQLLVAVAACGGCGSTNSSGPLLSDGCVSPGATYLETFAQTSGTCGALSSEVVDVSPDGSVPLASSMNCSSFDRSGCTLTYTDCTTTANGVSYTSTSSLTFAADGRSASGVATLMVAGNNLDCSSTYSVTATRQ